MDRRSVLDLLDRRLRDPDPVRKLRLRPPELFPGATNHFTWLHDTLHTLPDTAGQQAPLRQTRAYSDEQKAELDKISAYLNGIHSLKARFIQIGPEGGTVLTARIPLAQ